MPMKAEMSGSDRELVAAVADHLFELSNNCVSTVDQDLVRSIALAFRRLAENGNAKVPPALLGLGAALLNQPPIAMAVDISYAVLGL